MNQAVAGGYDHPPGDFGMGGADVVRDMGGGFADQLQVAQGGDLGKAAGHETSLVETVGIGEHLPDEVDHVIKIEAPFALAGIRH